MLPGSGAELSHPDPARSQAALPWLALGAAFSPVLFDLVRSLTAVDRSWGIAVAPILIVLCSRGEPASPRRPRLGSVALVAGVALQILGIAGGAWSVARLGLPVAFCGLALATGRPSLPAAALSLWIVPPPTAATSLVSSWLEAPLARFAAGVWSALGAGLTASGPLLRTPSGAELGIDEGGLRLAVLLAGMGWYAGVRARAGSAGLLRRALVFGLWAIPGQAVAVLGAAGLLLLGQPALGRHALQSGLPLVAFVLALAWIETRRRAG